MKRQGGKPLAPRLPPAVYYIPPGGKAVRIEEKMIRPNGIQLSRDEKTLYISDSNGVDVIAWDIQPDGLVRNRRDFGTLTGRSNAGQRPGWGQDLRGRHDHRQRRPALRRHRRGRRGPEPTGPARRHHPGEVSAGGLPERRVRRAGEKDSVHRRRGFALQGRDGRPGIYRTREVASSSV